MEVLLAIAVTQDRKKQMSFQLESGTRIAYRGTWTKIRSRINEAGKVGLMEILSSKVQHSRYLLCMHGFHERDYKYCLGHITTEVIRYCEVEREESGVVRSVSMYCSGVGGRGRLARSS